MEPPLTPLDLIVEAETAEPENKRLRASNEIADRTANISHIPLNHAAAFGRNRTRNPKPQIMRYLRQGANILKASRRQASSTQLADPNERYSPGPADLCRISHSA